MDSTPGLLISRLLSLLFGAECIFNFFGFLKYADGIKRYFTGLTWKENTKPWKMDIISAIHRLIINSASKLKREEMEFKQNDARSQFSWFHKDCANRRYQCTLLLNDLKLRRKVETYFEMKICMYYTCIYDANIYTKIRIYRTRLKINITE